jgi:hypothetical protein
MRQQNCCYNTPIEVVSIHRTAQSYPSGNQQNQQLDFVSECNAFSGQLRDVWEAGISSVWRVSDTNEAI